MNSCINSLSARALAIGVAFLGIALALPAAAKADGSHETLSGGLFAQLGQATVDEAERSVGRRGATATRRESGGRASKRRARGLQVASLGPTSVPEFPSPRENLTGGGNIRWAANAECLVGSLRGIVASVAASFGAVTVSSTCRSASRNRRVGGAPRSYHLTGNAVDFRVRGNVSGAASYLASLGRGYKHLGGGLFHIDTGPRRPF